MPHLQVDINSGLDDDQRRAIADSFKRLFSRVMDTGTDHIAIAIREYATYGLDIGRVTDHTLGVAQVNADVREGRSTDQRRELALGFMHILHDVAGVPLAHMYVTFTEHKGEDFHLEEKYLASWESGEDPLAD
ncbi:MAG: tautomerase [Gammaproteobacteria bacterium]|nr:tautomerase [Gammaproteobacteria bacterium]NNM00202.1 tautomerase [Gammaproteobacteria bacterium]